ncbi:MAG TPA: type I restriction-modification enzyme R subunit C-terminal domain-containing protein, partial [Pirellulales bacterium]|nr:type I restriction-modification enzyme R subunit C-terminal domain-containing protein [Pirellulales bacterium]
SEARTRRERVDPMLTAAGWSVVPFDLDRPLTAYARHALTEYPTENGPADYALVADGRLVGIVEAKKVTLGPQNVLTQAERYSKGVADSEFDFRGYRVPFLYSTNGEVLWFQDVRDPLNRSRRIARFHTPQAMLELVERQLNAAFARLAVTPNAHPKLRPYQLAANTATEHAIANRKRLMLLAMATGTGKTFTLVNQVYRLMKSGVGKRILFLVDRRALAAQAVRAFASFEPEPNKKFDKLYEVYSQRFQRGDFDDDEPFDPKVLPNEYLTAPQAKHAFVYVSTIQRMAINLFGRAAVWSGEGDAVDDDADRLEIPIHAFDVIVADECHRGYTTAEQSHWRNTLDHFDAIKIGLTATPAAHTKAYFNDVVFRYEYAQAVREGYLVDYDVVKVKSDVRMNGVFLQEGETVKIVDPETGNDRLDQLEDERQFEAPDVERTVTSPDSNKKILEELKKYTDEHQTKYGRFPKTLIFAANDAGHTSHADELVRLAVDVFGQGQSFVRKITGRADRPLQLIREFRNRPSPGIVVSVDLMSTGVDIPDLECIVFLRQVKSRILFEQMLGRGTRRGEKYPDKSHFTVFDCFDGTLLAYFRNATGITAEPPDKPGRTIKEVIDDIWENRDRDYNIRCLAKRLQRIDKEMDGSARELFKAHGIPDGDMARYAAGLATALRANFAGEMKLLRDKSFQELLVSYPRRRSVFLRAEEHEDTVSSEYLIRDGLGREHKPEDYLAAFARFVRENPARIDAIRILLDRPRNWGTAALTELRTKLTASPERFTVELLQKAHQVRYHKALADIISMVKHAARDEEPLLTAEERVAKAFDRVTGAKEFTPEQRQWLDRIRAHLVENLSIDRDDFDLSPVLTRPGGWTPADRAFGGNLGALVESLNEAVAA